MLTDEQINEFAERGYVLVPQVVQGDVLAQAARRVDEVMAADPPAADKRGSHFYFLATKDEPALMAPLTGTPAFSLAEELAGAGTLEIPWQVQIALNIPPYPHRPGHSPHRRCQPRADRRSGQRYLHPSGRDPDDRPAH